MQQSQVVSFIFIQSDPSIYRPLTEPSQNELIQEDNMHPIVTRIIEESIGYSKKVWNAKEKESFLKSLDIVVCEQQLPLSIGTSLMDASCVVIVVDQEMKILIWNTFAAKMLGYTAEEMTDATLTDAIQIFPGSAATTLTMAREQCLKGLPVHGSVIEATRKEGGAVKLLCSFTPLKNEEEVTGMIVMAYNITDVAQTPANAETATTPTEEGVPYRKAQFAGWDEVGYEYSIEKVLGQGSYGQVAQATHVVTGEKVAIKKIQNVFADPIDAKRILREMCIVRQLSHANLVQVFIYLFKFIK